MLYSKQYRIWKITDFGLAAEGTSQRAHTTRYARGIASYRAPELLTQSKSTYNNKVDIWALGCILYELIAHKQAFPDDFVVAHYVLSDAVPQLELPQLSEFSPRDQCIAFQLIQAMLAVDTMSRPSTSDVLITLTMVFDTGVGWNEPVRIYNCYHQSAISRGNHSNNLRAISLEYTSQLWNEMSWVRSWYASC